MTPPVHLLFSWLVGWLVMVLVHLFCILFFVTVFIWKLLIKMSWMDIYKETNSPIHLCYFECSSSMFFILYNSFKSLLTFTMKRRHAVNSQTSFSRWIFQCLQPAIVGTSTFFMCHRPSSLLFCLGGNRRGFAFSTWDSKRGRTAYININIFNYP